MVNFLVRYKILTNRGSGLTVGKFVEVYWNDVTAAFEVYEYDDDSDTSGTLRTSGPDLGLEGRIRNPDYEYISGLNYTTVDGQRIQLLNYSFCEGTTLQIFQGQPLFPYAKRGSIDNHFSCALNICDLQISDTYTIINASDTVTSDGAILITATSSNGPIKYSLNPDFVYASSGQPTGQFYSLGVGTYTVYAKDALGCSDSITLEVGVPNFYNVLYRLEYTDINNIPTRCDVLERGYLGEIITVKAGADPFVLRYRGEGEINKFKSVIPSEATLTLMSETNFFFRNLFSQDERKYQIRYYKNYGNTTPGFTPAVLDDLSLWTNQVNPDYVEVPPYNVGWDWVPGAVPVVSFGNSASSYSHTFDTRTDLYYTAYAFEAGRAYSFGYNLTGIASLHDGFGPDSATYKIQIVDSSKSVIIEKTVLYNPLSGASIGTYDFVAPTNAAGIAIIVLYSPAGSEKSYSIQEFTNLTAAEGTTEIGYELKWLGYIISSNYSEAYVNPPYEVSIVATDGLADLKLFDFVDKFSNKFKEDIITLKAICEILKKTDLNINILGAINKYEQDMDSGPDDDPLNQCKFDPETFYDGGSVKNCFETLEFILEPFGARLVQRNGKWLIYCVEEAVHEFAYREFDFEGVYIFNGTILDSVQIKNPVLEDRSAFRDVNQVLELIPTYGIFFFVYNLLLNPSLVKSYSFEFDDLLSHSGIAAFKNWNVNISHAPGATYGIKETKAFEGLYNFYFAPAGNNNVVNQGFVVVTSSGGVIEYDSTDSIEFRFNYAVLVQQVGSTTGLLRSYDASGGSYPSTGGSGSGGAILQGDIFTISVAGILPTGQSVGIGDTITASISTPGNTQSHWIIQSVNVKSINPVWVKLKWMLKIGNYYLNENVWTTDSNYKYNEIYVSSFNSVEELKLTSKLRNVGALTLETFEVEFVLCSSYVFDFISLEGDYTSFKAIPTINKTVGTKIKGQLTYINSRGSSGTRVLYWVLIDDDAATSGIEVVRPDDYNSDTNQKVWQLEDSVVTRLSVPRNTILNDFPSPENEVSFVYLDNVVLNHLPKSNTPPSNITIEKDNNKYIKINYEHEFLLNDVDIDNINNSERTYKNYFKKLDGAPTQVWTRTYRAGSDKILSLLADDFANQYKSKTNKLTGSLISDKEVTILSVMSEEFDSGRRYMFMGHELHDKECSINFDFAELKDVVNDSTSPDIDAEFTTDFSLDFTS